MYVKHLHYAAFLFPGHFGDYAFRIDYAQEHNIQIKSKELTHETAEVTLELDINEPFCVATGVFFGWYPARKAASLNPIDALKYE